MLLGEKCMFSAPNALSKFGLTVSVTVVDQKKSKTVRIIVDYATDDYAKDGRPGEV